MSATLKFKASEVRKLLDHTLACDEHSPTFGEMLEGDVLKDGATVKPGSFPKPEDVDHAKVKPALHLVKDSGIYLISNGIPRMLAEDGDGSYVVYAEGFEFRKGEDNDGLHERTTAAVGGDDFVERFPAEDILGALNDNPDAKFVCFRVSKTQISVWLS